MNEKKLTDEAVNATVKSLRWLCNQIPQDLGDSNEEKMLKCIRLYCEQGIEVILRLQSENESQRKIIEYQDSVEDKNAELQKQVDELKDICLDCPYKLKFDEIEKQSVKSTAKEILIPLVETEKQIDPLKTGIRWSVLKGFCKHYDVEVE